jgi:hypothetical protein
MDQGEWTKVWENLSSLEEIVPILKQIEAGTIQVSAQSQWSLGKILSHCAQSIQYSIESYPEMKSALFRGSVGKIAFSIFAFKNKMNHGLEEPIPGATEIPNDIDTKQSIRKLLLAIESFQSKTNDELKPHFAYGVLSKEEYDLAHTLHIKNHFEKILWNS